MVAEESRMEESQTQLEKTSKTLVDIKTGTEHLTEKLKVLKSVCIPLFLQINIKYLETINHFPVLIL